MTSRKPARFCRRLRTAEKRDTRSKRRKLNQKRSKQLPVCGGGVGTTTQKRAHASAINTDMALTKLPHWEGNMAAIQSKLSVRKKQLVRRGDQSTKPKNSKRSTRKRLPFNKPSPGEFALRERTLPGRRFVEFPLVKGKIAERVQLFTTTNNNSLSIDFQDQTSLLLNIEPG